MEVVTSDLRRAATLLIKRIDYVGRMSVASASIYIVLAGLLAAVPAALIGHAVNDVIGGEPLWAPDILTTLLLLCAALVAYELMQVCRKYLIESVAVRLQAEAQLGFSRTLLECPVDALHGRQIGEIITLIDKGVTGLVRLMKLMFLEFGPALATSVIAVVFVLTVHWLVALGMLAVLLLNAAITLWQIHSQRGIRVDLLTRRATFNGQVGELIMNLDSVRASGVAGLEQAEFRKASEAIRSTEFRHHKAMMAFDAIKGLFDGGGLIVVLVVSLALYASGAITGGDIVKITLLYQNAVVPLKMLHRIVDESHEAAIHILRAETLAEIGVDPGLLGHDLFPDVAKCRNAFEASNLSFGFANGGRKLLHNVCYAAPRGTFDIIFGETGSGKSALLRIMLGLNAGYTGTAKVFGAEVKTSDKELLGRRICYVAQEPFVRSGNLRSNLLLGLHRTASDDELERAARLAGISLGNEAWRDGLSRLIAERGKGLAGGERQRIALARLFLSDAELFILDEATSQLDEPMEDLILGNLCRMCSSKAVVMVAHRTTTLKWAKRSFKLVDGKLTELRTAQEIRLAPSLVLAG